MGYKILGFVSVHPVICTIYICIEVLQLLGLRDNMDVKYRNSHLSHLIRYRYTYFSPTGQEYPFLQVSEIFLSRPAISA